MGYIIAKQNNEPVFAKDSAELGKALDDLNMDRGRFVHQGGTNIEIAPLYKSNGWLVGCVYHVMVDAMRHGLDANARIAGNRVEA